MTKSLTIIGLMSGTSLDGLDICSVKFSDNNFKILDTKHIPYLPSFREELDKAYTMSAIEIAQLDVDFGKYCGNEIKKFIKDSKIDYIASHGQTIFHTPNTGLTLQIGSGEQIAAITGIPTINNFRTLDVAHGGQGAPLVPIGDRDLFSKYTYCLNIGGFANVSTDYNGKRIAWDICPTNIILNEFAKKYGKDFDENGDLGNEGYINKNLLSELNSLPFYSQKAPKSLGREWIEQYITPLINTYGCSGFDKMRTLYEHMGFQIGKTLSKKGKTLCTGGGTYNSLLIERIQHYTESEIIIPNEEIIDFKEALLFAYLGYLRVLEKPNCLASVTGASKDVCSGTIHLV